MNDYCLYHGVKTLALRRNLYKLGSIKGRLFMYIPVAGFLITLLLITKIPAGGNKLLFAVINSPALLMFSTVILVAVMYAVSILVSVKILENKEM